MENIINWEIISNPVNWIIVALMLAIAVFGLNLVLTKEGSILSTGSGGL
jgi:hypothetical protein